MKEIKERWTAAKFIRSNGTILDFTGLYEVSDQGRVRSLNYNHTKKAKVLRQNTLENNDGSIYYTVWICKDGKKYNKTVHRLVLSSFVPEGFRPGRIVNHKVERTPFVCDNSLVNLEWTTPKENVNTDHCKELHINRKDLSKTVTVTDLSTGRVATYPSTMETERSLCLPHNTVSTMIRKQNGYYKKLGLHFKYV